MRLAVTERFVRAYDELRPEVQSKVDQTLTLLLADPRHPSLRLKKMRGPTDIWEARVDQGIRMTLEVMEDHYLLRNVGKHDETLRKP